MITIFRNLLSPPRHMILLVLAIWLGLILAEKRSERHGISKDDLNNLTFYGLIAFILGGRIVFVLQNISAFTKSPLSLFSINPTLFDTFGALATAILAAWIICQRKKLLLWPTLDALTPLFAIMAIGLAFSHLAAGTAFGLPADLPWSIHLWNANRHPAQLYEIFASTLILGLLWFKKHDPRPGLLFITFAAFTAGSRVFLYAFRADQTSLLGGIKQGQVIALVILALSFVLLEIRFREFEK